MDDIFKQNLIYQPHSNELFSELVQPTEELIYSRNAELRKNKGVLNDMCAKSEGGSWGRQIASIPFVAYERAKLAGYDLDSKDAQIASNEMDRFLASEEGRKCLVVNSVLTKLSPGIIIK